MAENRALSTQQLEQLVQLSQVFDRNAKGAQALVDSIGANLTGMAKGFESLANTLKDTSSRQRSDLKEQEGHRQAILDEL